jgi:hypothetical protein
VTLRKVRWWVWLIVPGEGYRSGLYSARTRRGAIRMAQRAKGPGELYVASKLW